MIVLTSFIVRLEEALYCLLKVEDFLSKVLSHPGGANATEDLLYSETLMFNVFNLILFGRLNGICYSRPATGSIGSS